MTKIINFSDYRKTKGIIDKIKEKRSQEAEDFGDRMERTRASLERINQLMGELRKSSEKKKD